MPYWQELEFGTNVILLFSVSSLPPFSPSLSLLLPLPLTPYISWLIILCFPLYLSSFPLPLSTPPPSLSLFPSLSAAFPFLKATD